MSTGAPRKIASFILGRSRVALALAAAIGLCLGAALGVQAIAADAKAKVTIYVVRHGETDWNLQGRIQGSTDNVLNAKGQEQAAAIASQLAQVPIDHIYPSGLARAIQTAEAFKGKAPTTPQPSLNERSFGIFEGKVDKDVAKDLGARATNLNDELDGGESLASQAKRVGKATREIVERHRGETVMIVAHSGVNPLVIGELIGLTPDNAVKQIRQSNDEVYKLEVFADGAVTIWKLVPPSRLDQL